MRLVLWLSYLCGPCQVVLTSVSRCLSLIWIYLWVTGLHIYYSTQVFYLVLWLVLSRLTDSWSSCFIWANFVLSVRTPSLAMKCSSTCLSIKFGSFASSSDSWKSCTRFSSSSLPAMVEQKAVKAFPFASYFGSTGMGSTPSSGVSGGGSLSYHPSSLHQSLNIWMNCSHFLHGSSIIKSLGSMTAATLCPDKDAMVRFIPSSESTTKTKMDAMFIFLRPECVLGQAITMHDVAVYTNK